MKQVEPHQESGAAFLASRYHAACGDERGLGKTVTAIRAAEMLGLQSILVTCPASVRTSWQEHMEEWRSVGMCGVDVISYNYRGPVRDRYDLWIGDEIHFCKSTESQRSHLVFGRDGLAQRAAYKWPLSGTMSPNGRPVELYPMLKTLAPAFAQMNFSYYTQRYCGAYFDGRGWNVKGASRIDELATMLRDFMIRRTAAEVYPDRKRPLVSRVSLELTPFDLAAVRVEEDAVGVRPSRLSPTREEFSQMGDTSRLLHLLGLAKVAAAAEFVDDLLESVEKVAVFYHHRDVGAALREHFKEVGTVEYGGGMGDEAKALAVRRFADLAHRVFLGQQVAAGTGINGLQQVCSSMVLIEPSWTPGDTEQVIGRLDRIGQKDELVRAYLLYARGTLDAVKVAVHDRKERTGERLMDDSRTERLAEFL